MSDQQTIPAVFGAWNHVMEEVRELGKNQRNRHQGFNFRGIDDVLNVVGPALRKHGVTVVPVKAEVEREDYTTSKGAQMRGAHSSVTFRVYGPDGSFFDGQVCGEASDSGDKATPKAMSVALRTFLLQALCLPTDEQDPDAESHERAPAQQRQGAAQPGPSANAPTAQQTSEQYAEHFRKKFHAWLRDVGLTDAQKKAWLKKQYGLTSTNDLDDAKRGAILGAVDNSPDRLRAAIVSATAQKEVKEPAA